MYILGQLKILKWTPLFSAQNQTSGLSCYVKMWQQFFSPFLIRLLVTFWKMSLSSMYLNTVMKLVSLSSTSFSVIPLADFFSRLSQYFASWTETQGGTWPGQGMGYSTAWCSVCVCVCVRTHEFRGFADGLGLPEVNHRRQSLRKRHQINTGCQMTWIVREMKINTHLYIQ